MEIEIFLNHNPPEFIITFLDYTFEVEAWLEEDQKIEAIINIKEKKVIEGE